jgi:SAM-dependent methyltransferase
VTSSIYDYEQLHGRTYHAYHGGKYILPNDEDEQERCDIMYHAVRLSVGNKLHFAPIQDPINILDIGTGTGLWAIEMADAFPAAEVWGTDLSPIQPSYVPPNLHFEIADADEEWTYRQKFDLVHTRVMNDTSLKDWSHFYREAFKVLKPGGWVESQEFSYRLYSDDNTIPKDSSVMYWEALWTEGVQKQGLQGHCNPDLVYKQMQDAGFINITRLNFKMPIGPWPKDPTLREAGEYGRANLLFGFYGLSVKVFTQLLGWQVEELEVLLAKCRQELNRREIHGYWPM